MGFYYSPVKRLKGVKKINIFFEQAAKTISLCRLVETPTWEAVFD